MKSVLRLFFLSVTILHASFLTMGQVISGFSPIYGSPNGPGQIRIYGSGFWAASPKQPVVWFNGKPAKSVFADMDTQLSCYVTNDTPLGASNILLRVGNGPIIQSSSNFTVICLNCPFVTSFAPSVYNGQQVVFNGAGLMAANAIFNGGAVPQNPQQSETVLTVTVPTTAQSGSVIITNAYGRFTNTALFYMPPGFTSLSPSSGRTLTNVIMRGTNFLGATSVLFQTNGGFVIPASYTVLSNSAVNIVVPTNAVTGLIQLTAPAGSVQSTTFKVPPTISGFSPTIGNVGTNVTITGLNLNGASPSVSFGGVAAASVTPVSFNQIQARVPSGATNSVISVTTTDGSDTSAAIFYMPPSITTFSPANTFSGSTVKITGVNFSNASAVTFNGGAATFWVTNSNTIGVSIPSGVSSGYIAVTAPAGTATSSTKFYGVPVINSFNPPSGLPGTNVTLTGTNLLDASKVFFNGLQASSITPVDNGTVRAVVPANAQTGPVTVVTPGGTNISSGNFVLNYTNDIIVTGSVTPEPVLVGGKLTNVITVLNSSSYNAANVFITNFLPSTVKLLTYGITTGSLDTSGNPIVGNIGTLSPNSSSVLTFTVSPQSGGLLTNTAVAVGGQNDPNLTNNTLNLASTVIPKLRAFRTKTNTVVFGWPAPSTGFTLQQKGALGTTNWTPVTNVPVPTYVNNAVTTNENQVVIAPQTNSAYRLKLQTP